MASSESREDSTPVSRIPSAMLVAAELVEVAAAEGDESLREATPLSSPPVSLGGLGGSISEGDERGPTAEVTHPGERGAVARVAELRAAKAAQELGGAPAHDPYIDSVLDGRYHILRRVGEGGMGVVYLANHVNLERHVAVKILSEDFARKADLVRRFIQEARAAVSIKHENIVEVYDFGETESGSVYFAMEYLEGQDLAQLVKTEPFLPGQRVRFIVRQICRALAAAHSKQIVHRDLKPENIFLIKREERDDFVKVLDFGIAKISSVSESQGRLTRTGMIFGTPEYMSPEQARGETPDHRVDIYALGCILYEMLTGVVPFSADSFMGVLTKHMFEPVVPPSRRLPGGDRSAAAPREREAPPAPRYVEPELEAICLRAMEKDRDRRFQTMGEMAAALAGDMSTMSSMSSMVFSGGAVMTPMGPDSSRSVPVSMGLPSAPGGVHAPMMIMGSAPVPGMQPLAQSAPVLLDRESSRFMDQSQMPYQPMLPGPGLGAGVQRHRDPTTQSPLPPSQQQRRAWFVAAGLVAGLTILGGVLWYAPKEQQPTGTIPEKVGSQQEPAQPRQQQQTQQAQPRQQQQTQPASAEVKPAPKPAEPAYLDLKGTPGASVTMGAQKLGQLPLQRHPIPLSTGELQVRLQIHKSGYADGTVDVVLRPGQLTSESVTLNKVHGSKAAPDEDKTDKPDKPDKPEKVKPPPTPSDPNQPLKLKDPFR